MYYYLLVLDLVFYALGYKSPYLKRLAYYFCIAEIMLLSGIPKIISKTKDRQMITIVIIGYAILKFVITAYVLKQGNLIPYQTIFI